MSAKTIKSALGLLQDDPDHSKAWKDLQDEVGRDPGMTPEELGSLLEAARRAHEGRRETEAVGRMLTIEVARRERLAPGGRRRGRAGSGVRRGPARRLRVAACVRASAGAPTGRRARDRGHRAVRGQRGKWQDLADRYVQEAKGTADPTFHSSLLVSAAEVTVPLRSRRRQRRGAAHRGAARGGARDRPEEPTRRVAARARAARVGQVGRRWPEPLERFAQEAPQKDEKTRRATCASRACSRRTSRPPTAAVAAYERVLDLVPGHAEATSFLASHLHLARDVGPPRGPLRGAARDGRPARQGRGARGVSADRHGQLAHAHQGGRRRAVVRARCASSSRRTRACSSFFREWCNARGESARLATILTDAQRAMPDGPDAHRRRDRDRQARRGGRERPEGDRAVARALAPGPREQGRARRAQAPLTGRRRAGTRSPICSRQSSTGSRPTTRPGACRCCARSRASTASTSRATRRSSRCSRRSCSSIRTICRACASSCACTRRCGAWRDLLTMQARLAELETEPSVKAELYRTIARRWLDQFSNVQNAVEAYEKLLERRAAPTRGDRQAQGALREAARRTSRSTICSSSEAGGAGGGRRRGASCGWRWRSSPPSGSTWARRPSRSTSASSTKSPGVGCGARRAREAGRARQGLRDRRRRARAARGERVRRRRPARRAAEARRHLRRSAPRSRAGPMSAVAPRARASSPGTPRRCACCATATSAAGDYDGLTALYAQNSDWEGLVEVLSGAADKATDAALKIGLSLPLRRRSTTDSLDRAGARVPRVRARPLGRAGRRARGRARSSRSTRRTRSGARLPALYEVLLGHAEDDEGKLALLDKLVQVTGPPAPGPRRGVRVVAQRRTSSRRRARARSRRSSRRRARRRSGSPSSTPSARAWPRSNPRERGRGPARKRRRTRTTATAAGAKRSACCGRSSPRSTRASSAASTRRWRRTARSSRRTTATSSRCRRSIASCASPTAATICAGSSTCASSARTRRRSSSSWASGPSSKKRRSARPSARSTLYRRMLEVVPHHGPALRALARLLRAQGDAEGAADVIALDRDQREGHGARGARDRARAAARRAAAQARRGARPPPSARSSCRRTIRGAVAVVEQLLAIVGDARARRRDPRACLRRDRAPRAARPRSSRCSSRRRRRAATACALYAAPGGRPRDKLGGRARARSTSSRARPTSSPGELALWDRLAVLAIEDRARAGVRRRASCAVVPPEGETGLPPAVELDLAERAATLYDEKLGDVDRARPYLERMLARAAGQRARLPAPQADPHDARAVERARGALRARRRRDAEPDAADRAARRGGARRRGDHRRSPEGDRLLRAHPRDRPGARAGGARARHALRRRAALGQARRAPRAPAPGRRGRRARSTSSQRLGTLLFNRIGDAAGALVVPREVLRERPAADGSAAARREDPRRARAPRARGRRARGRVHRARRGARSRARARDPPRVRRAGPTSAAISCAAWPSSATSALATTPGRSTPTPACCRSIPTTRARAAHAGHRAALGAHERAAGVLTATAAAANAPLPRAEILMDVARLFENQLDDVGARRGRVPPGPAARAGRRDHRAAGVPCRSSASTRPRATTGSSPRSSASR